MTRYLLDTNILSVIIRNPTGPVVQHLAEVGEKAVCTSIIVAAELRLGAKKRGSQRLTRQMERVLDTLEILPFDEPADVAYGTLRSLLEAAGTPIGANDMLIAAHGLALGCTVVTDNEREFSRIEGLTIENWLRSD